MTSFSAVETDCCFLSAILFTMSCNFAKVTVFITFSKMFLSAVPAEWRSR
ncbi:hypothetical protein HanHA300_Chr03g0094381 [Helianthus annuus]|nr:hypothetical protein HanHA300_Chr03g0094381 [Helianthus annuus]KAJ0608215.1 hypothetical protein HanHA89_Chr03g0106101 [Helianthus annuus]